MKRIKVIVVALLSVAAAAQAQERYPLWQGGVPGFESRAGIPELSREFWTRHVNNPSVTIYRPDQTKRNGTAILILPGGGHVQFVTTSEGETIGRWLADRGVTAFVLRYRLFREEGSPYTLTDARADTERAGPRTRQRRCGRPAFGPPRFRDAAVPGPIARRGTCHGERAAPFPRGHERRLLLLATADRLAAIISRGGRVGRAPHLPRWWSRL